MHSSTIMAKVDCPSPERLLAFLAGKCSAAEHEGLEQHLLGCDACQTELNRLAEKEDSFDDALRQAATSSAAAPIERMRDYTLLKRIGSGAIGEVFQARHEELQRIVAVKLLRPEHLFHPQAETRFQRELKAMGGLHHPNIVQAFDAGRHEGRRYLVMEYVQGWNLSHLIRLVGPLSIADACEIIRQVALGLDHAHQHGLIHRDIKPSNVMLDERGDVKILDLGLAGFNRDPEKGNTPSAAIDEPSLTQSNVVVGTPGYIAPEQFDPDVIVDCRADIYSLGCVLYKLLTGVHPAAPLQGGIWPGGRPSRVLRQRRKIPRSLVALVERMMAPQPDRRPATAEQAASLLARFTRKSNLPLVAQRASAGPTEPDQPTPKRSFFRKRAFLSVAVVFCLTILLVIGGGYLSSRSPIDELPVALSGRPGEVVGFVWCDANGNGVHERGEKRIAGAAVEAFVLRSPSSPPEEATPLASAVTDEQGRYRFSGLPFEKPLRLVFRSPGGYTFTRHNAKASQQTSHVDHQGTTESFTLHPSGPGVILNAGLEGKSPAFGFAQRMGGPEFDNPGAVAAHPDGGFVLGGRFRQTVDFDPGAGEQIRVAKNVDKFQQHTGSGFVARYTQQGALAWVRDLRCSSISVADVVVDSEGNVYVGGGLQGDLDLNVAPSPGHEITHQDKAINTFIDQKGFIIKFDKNGKYIWSRDVKAKYGGVGEVAVDPHGNIYVCGSALGRAIFDKGNAFEYTPEAADKEWGFVWKLAPDGQSRWLHAMTSTQQASIDELECDSQAVYLAGRFKGAAEFPTHSSTDRLESRSHSEDVFLLKLELDGSFCWARRMGGDDDDRLYDMTRDDQSNLYLGGHYESRRGGDYGLTKPSQPIPFKSRGYKDAYIAKIDAQGELQWVYEFGGQAEDYVFGVAATESHVYACGFFQSDLNFNPCSSTNRVRRKNQGGDDLFLLRLNSQGEFESVFTAGGKSDDRGQAVVADSTGRVYLTGRFQSRIDLDPVFKDYTLNSNGDFDIFLLGLGENVDW